MKNKKLKVYRVEYTRTTIGYVLVEAENEKQALEYAEEGEIIKDKDLYYSTSYRTPEVEA